MTAAQLNPETNALLDVRALTISYPETPPVVNAANKAPAPEPPVLPSPSFCP